MFSKFVSRRWPLAWCCRHPAHSRRTSPRFASRWTGSSRASTPGIYWAQEKGYFAAEKLDVTIDQGEGSAATVTRIMSGAYDAGFGDTNAVIQNAATKPGQAPVMVYMIYIKAPFALLTKASSPIHSFKDLAGKKLGSPGGRRGAQAVAADGQEERRRSRQDRCPQHGAEPAGADAAAGTGRRRSRSSPPRAT